MAAQKPGAYKGLTEARRRANKKYNDRFVEIKVRVTPEKRSVIKDHAESMGETSRFTTEVFIRNLMGVNR